MLGALLIALVELEWERLVALIRFTHYWTGRAVLQVRETRPSSPPLLELHPGLGAQASEFSGVGHIQQISHTAHVGVWCVLMLENLFMVS